MDQELVREFSLIGDRLIKHEETLSEHTKGISVLEEIARNITKQLDKISDTYNDVKSTLIVYTDIKKLIDDHETRIRYGEKFISNLKGKLTILFFIGSFVMPILSTIVIQKINSYYYGQESVQSRNN